MKTFTMILFTAILFGCASEKEDKNNSKKEEKKKETQKEAEKQEEMEPEIKKENAFHSYSDFFLTEPKELNSSKIQDASSEVSKIGSLSYFLKDYDQLILKSSNELKSEKITPIKITQDLLSTCTNKLVSIENNYEGKSSSFSERIEEKKSKGKELFAKLYFSIDLNNDFQNYFTAVVEKNEKGKEYEEWEIISFDANGQAVSSLGRIDEFYVWEDQIISLWYYASDQNPTYEIWKQNEKGQFIMTSSSKKEPEQLKSIKAKMEL